MRIEQRDIVIFEIGDHVMTKLDFYVDQFSGFSGVIIGFQGDNYEERLAIIHVDEQFRKDGFRKPFHGEYFVRACNKLQYLPNKNEEIKNKNRKIDISETADGIQKI